MIQTMDLRFWVQQTTQHIHVVILVTLDTEIKAKVSHFDFLLSCCFNFSYNNKVKLYTI